jgi:hypothetical protein
MNSQIILNNTEDILQSLSPALAEKLSFIFTMLKIAGVILIIYIIYLIIKGILRWKMMKRIKRIERKVLEIDKKLDTLVGEKSKSERKSHKKNKKKRKK